MAIIHEAECEAANLEISDVQRIAKGLNRYAREAERLGIHVFGGSGTGTLRFNDGGDGLLILADLDGHFDGGDGGAVEDDNGLLRGEF